VGKGIDPAAERIFLSSVQRTGRRLVRELADGIPDAAADGRTVVIVLRGELVGARGALLERGTKFFNSETLSA
jgi:chaperonin GroEL (HSP60 family)